MARISDDKTCVSVLCLQVAWRRRYMLYSLFSLGGQESARCSWGFLDVVWLFFIECFRLFVWKIYCCPVDFSTVCLYKVVELGSQLLTLKRHLLMMILKLEAKGADLVCAHLHWLWAGCSRCSACSLGVAITLTSGSESHRKQTWERGEEWGLSGESFGLGGKSSLSLIKIKNCTWIASLM